MFKDTIGSNNELRVTIHWGINGVDKTGVGAWIPTDLGTLIFDDKFDVSPPANQMALLNLCQKLRESELVENEQVTCWIEHLDRFIRE